jgi:hypothetical protein
MVIRREATASKEIGTAVAAGVNLRRANLVFAKHEPFAIQNDVAELCPDCVHDE